jgi:hypothetical protein
MHSFATSHRMALVASVICIAAVAVLGAGAASASAAINLNSGGSASTRVVCSASMRWMRTTVSINRESRFSSQAVAYHLYVAPTSGATGSWTDWTYGTAGSSPYTNLTVQESNAGGHNLQVYVQYAWWNGSSWASAGEWITSYTQVQGSNDSQWQMSYCAI